MFNWDWKTLTYFIVVVDVQNVERQRRNQDFLNSEFFIRKIQFINLSRSYSDRLNYLFKYLDLKILCVVISQTVPV